MRIARWLGIALGLSILLVAIVGLAARFSDGPIAIFPGGPLVAGERMTEPITDWSFAREVDTIEFQLVDPQRSRTVWIVEHRGSSYIPCGYLDVPLWKQWPHEAQEDGRAIIRVQGRLYAVQVTRVRDPETYGEVAARVAEKYGLPQFPRGEPETTWIFRVDSRS